MADFRKKLLINITESHLGFTIEEATWEKDILQMSALEEFLENESKLILCACLETKDNNKRIKYFDNVLESPQNGRTVVFSKHSKTALRNDNLLQSIDITSMHGSPASALYHTLNNIYSPLIIKSQKNNPTLEKHLSNLQAGLRASLITELDKEILSESEEKPESLAMILSVDQEVEYWHKLAAIKKTPGDKAAANAFRDMLIPLAKDIAVLDALPLTDLEDMQENTHNILDDLWKHEPPYPKARMEHLMEIFSNDLVSYITKQFTKVDIWKEDYNKAIELLEQCLDIGKHWLSSCRELTEIFWPNYSMHYWRGPPFVPENLANLVERLLQIKEIRATHRQLTRLLTTEEHFDLNCDQMFVPFENFNPLQCGMYADQNWSTANKQFEYLLKPAEQTVANKLKEQFSTVKANTRQLLYEYGRYAELICRPVLKTILQTERKHLLSLLREYIKVLASQMSQTPMLSTKYETPQVVAEILGTRQLESKTNEVLSISRKILNDLENFQDLETGAIELMRDLKDQHTDLYEAWTSEILEQIKSKNLSLCEDDPVVQFTPNKLMRVNYSPRLVTLISEVRQLSTLGYNIPETIVTTSNHAKQFMNYAKYLEQIAHFHNTIGDIMIQSQRPMMLPSAIALSKLVQEQEVVSWGDIKSVEVYVQNLKSAVDKLSKENNMLTSYNVQVTELINKLRGVDLIKHYEKWRGTTKTLRDIMHQVQEKGFVPSSMVQWKQDIDKRLAKVLEEQYIKSLDTVHLHMPEINCDLIYRDGKLKFSPDEKALKEKYEQQMKESLDIPKKFRAVSENNEVFAEIIEKCKFQLEKVQGNTEKLFDQLQGVKKHWQAWLTLDKLDVSMLGTWQDWELHFRASKTFGQEIAKLPSEEEKVGCFKIGLSWLRSDLESHNRSYWDQLVNTLKDSIAQDVVKLQDYVDASTATLNRQPLTLEQIGEADASHADILNQKPEMEALHKELMQKVHILSSWNRERIDAVNRMQAGWERLQNLMENYQHIIAKQVETIKTTLTIASENLNNEIERFGAKWDQVKPRPNSGQISTESLEELNKHYQDIKEKKEQWKELTGRQQKITQDFAKFGLETPTFELLEEIDKDLNKEENDWAQFSEFYQGLEALSNEEWIVFRRKYYKLQDFLTEWEGKLEGEENSPLITRVLQEIHKYQAAAPVLKLLKGEDFTDKHWMEVYDVLGIMPKSIDVLALKDFLRISDRLTEKQNQLQSICKKAASEIIVRQTLQELDQWDVQAKFQFTSQVDSKEKEVFLIKDFKEHLSKIGDHQSLLQSVKNSADYESFAGRADVWETRLTDLDLYLTQISQIQRKWIYLEPIFGSGTLANEKSRFEKLDREFRSVLTSIQKDARVCAILRYPNLRATLANISEQLSRCQKGLDDFLAEKREKFPRFLFLGDDDLLEVVGQSSKEHVIQSHLKKLFAGIHSTVIDDTGKNITGIRSLQGETVQLSLPVNINQPVELWLNQLVKEMQNSLQSLLVQCLSDGKSPDPLKYPSQILCLAASVHFTAKCEQAIGAMGLQQLLATYKSQLKYYSNVDVSSTDPESQNSMGSESESNLLEIKLKALLLDTIQYIDIIEMLIESNVTKLSDWQWQQQLRFYATSFGVVTIKMVNAEMEYSYEYIGNAQKLVRTPLTEKCFLTLTQGMHLGMGGNPYGPAGTGKTESVKALGGLLGRQVLVFNCDEGIDAASMGRILSGLVRSGAWGCFDEFNRLDEATLSAISMYIQPIQSALRTHSKVVTLMEKEIEVNPHCGIFVTLNPAGGGYGGRNKLPDNLKQLFRPVVMTHPDHEQIARTLLHCDGYQQADTIGRKLVELFSLAEKLLSKQQHYDWGLRALRTVLIGCGRAIKEYRKTNSQIESETEFALVINATRLDTLSKLTYNDAFIFDNLLKEIFPKIETAISTGDPTMIKALHDSFGDLKLQVNKRQVAKCMELYEQLRQRMGVALVGPPRSGKSTIRNLLVTALGKQGKSIKQHVFNPKSMPRTQLLGQIDHDTRQWTDGVLTQYSLQVINESMDVLSFIVCDGDIDPEWVESLNSVMDDNRLLSLPSGWRVQFGPNVNFIFETHDLSHASPATISRMGIVFLSEEDVELQGFVETFLDDFTEESEGLISTFIEDYFYGAMEWIMNQGELVIQTPKISLAKTALTLVKNARNKEEFIVNLVNSLGGQLESDFREVFAQQMFETAMVNVPTHPAIAFYDVGRKLVDSYSTNAPNTEISEDNKIPLILTGKISHAMEVIKNWFTQDDEHILIVGPHGAAKTLLIEKIHETAELGNLAMIHCSAHVTPQYVIHKIIQYCLVVSSSRGKIYRPKRGHLTLFLKNLHLLKADKWSTNMLTAFLQQLIAYKGFFDANLEWVYVENITVVGTMANQNQLSSRFTSLFNIFNVDLPENEDMNTIFTTYMSAILKKANINGTWSKQKITKLTATLLKVFIEIKDQFSEVNKRHYVFSPHDLTNWCKGILRYKLLSNDIENILLEVICNEALRIFHDRLVSSEERVQFKEILNKIIAQEWNKPNILGVVADNYFVAASFNNRTQAVLTKLNADDWSTIVRKGIIQYEREGYSLDVEIIPELLHLTATLSRALTSAGGHCLLAGNSGVGRRSAVKIISVLEGAKLITPIGSDDNQFKNDLKTAIHAAAIEGEQVYFLLEDHILQDNNVLNMLNILLSSGEVPGLFNNAELDSLIAGLKDEAGRTDFDGNLYEFFVERTKNNLHILICMEIQNDNFWKILENCPGIIQKCTQIWMNEWSKETMKIIPKLIIKKHNEKSKEEKIEPSKYFTAIESVVNEKLSSPFRYINMISSYIKIYKQKQKTLVDQQKKLVGGTSKLTEAGEVVADLKVKAAEQQEKLAEKQKAANKALDMISNTMKNANVKKEQMEVLKTQTEKENIQLVKRKKEIELELAEVEPLIQEARNAIGNIKAEALSEIRSLRAPPEVIRDILEGVLRLMGIQDTSWNSMKTFLAKRGVKEDIRAFDAGRITSANREAVEKLIANKHDSFEEKNAKRASVAAAPLASWVSANVRYSKVMQKIKPLENEQNKLKENLSEAESQLSSLSAGLLDVDATVEQLKKELATFTREGAEIEIKLNAAQETLQSAEGLVGKLIDEYERWQAQLKELEVDLKKLPTNCLLAAGFLNYLSGESEDIREEIMSKWLEIVQEDLSEFMLENFLSTEREQMQWQSDGLATDQLSIQNAIIINQAKMCPFLIDPTSMGINWIKNRYKNKSFEATTQISPKFNTSLELAIRFGKVFLIEEVETISAILLTLLRKQFIQQGERTLINLNGKLIDYNKEFQLLLSSRNANLQLPGDLTAIINIINFTTTRAGLTEQLLISAIKQESPELAERRKNLLRQREEFQEKQHKLQTQLLEDLATSQGNILENKNLLASLNETKASSVAITQALAESSIVQEKLMQEYDVYREISKFGSALYFGAKEFLKTNVIYALSVASFTKLFLSALPTMEGLQSTENYRHKILIQSLYQYMGRGIFKSDRLKFLLHLAHKMFPEQIPEEEWNVLIGNVLITNRPETSKSRESVPAWIVDHSTNQVSLLQMILPSVYTSLDLENEMLWKDFMQSPKCEANFPKHCKLSEFQKVLVVQALRTDRLYSAMTQCVLHLTGMNNFNLEVLNLSQVYKESTHTQPILLITTSGNDPSNAIRELAMKEMNGDKYVEMSMGEGQEHKAITTLQETAQAGKWLILKNLHLVTTWLPNLCQNLQEINAAPNFRLWLVTEAHPNFSSVLAETSLKLAYEAPVGIRNNLFKIFTNYGNNFVQSLNTTASRIFFVLGLVHAILQERRSYIPQGWSKWYEFSDVDLSSMVKLSEELWGNASSHNMQWKYLIGWAVNAVYGGRIEKREDLTILDACVQQYFVDEVLSHRWKPLGILNSLPSSSNYQDYLNFITHISLKDVPAYFGLPENVDRAWERNTSANIIQYLKNLSITKDLTTNQDQMNKNLQLYVALWKKINQGHDFIRQSLPNASHININYSLETFIIDELRFALVTVQNLHKTFSYLNKMAKGQLIGDEKYLKISEELLTFKTPTAWLKLWNGPKEPARFLKDLINKTITISRWNENPATYYHHPMDISQFFNAETFLSAFKKQFAGARSLAIDELALKSYWKPKDGSVCLTGLHIEGALFDGINLLATAANSDSVNPTPDVYIMWEDKKNEVDDRMLQVPLYYASDREKLLTNLQVPCSNKERLQWIQAGVAFILHD